MANRKASIERKTKETDIVLSLNIDGAGTSQVDTGIGFLITCWTYLRFMVYLTSL